jgi:hypothetical protein
MVDRALKSLENYANLSQSIGIWQVYCGECSEANIMWSSSAKVNCVLLFCSVVVIAIYMATIRVYLHDVSLMLVRVEGAHGGEGGALGQHTWYTQCPFRINRNKV